MASRRRARLQFRRDLDMHHFGADREDLGIDLIAAPSSSFLATAAAAVYCGHRQPGLGMARFSTAAILRASLTPAGLDRFANRASSAVLRRRAGAGCSGKSANSITSRAKFRSSDKVLMSGTAPTPALRFQSLKQNLIVKFKKPRISPQSGLISRYSFYRAVCLMGKKR